MHLKFFWTTQYKNADIHTKWNKSKVSQHSLEYYHQFVWICALFNRSTVAVICSESLEIIQTAFVYKQQLRIMLWVCIVFCWAHFRCSKLKIDLAFILRKFVIYLKTKVSTKSSTWNNPFASKRKYALPRGRTKNTRHFCIVQRFVRNSIRFAEKYSCQAHLTDWRQTILTWIKVAQPKAKSWFLIYVNKTA